METLTPEMDGLKAHLKGTWSAGDFGRVATSYEAGAADFIARLGLKPGQRVLDVACGTGNLALPAARAGTQVVGIDIAPNLVEQARQRAVAQNLSIRFEEGDAEALPYENGSFDVVVSMFGAMFAPRPDLVASELARVTRAGGTIAMANWMPGSFIGQMFKTIGALVPPPPIMPSPLQWGDEARVRERFGTQIAQLTVQPRTITFHFEELAPADVVAFWREYYGPTQRAFEALASDAQKQTALRLALEQLWTEHNRARDGGTVVESEYLEVLAVRA
ncbi:Methyltransferase domain-containing protein [Variovorax sp. CF079]|uniref:class I SAM-dependent methyltransferase n=1 Tax=Variovorax sp. CF079 TaxID=1882774 RepID=UPI00088CB0DA|nr:class I SAM-dependent methyltransferase [Variovorax sp. CF079]SDE68736.1 Methyltransferase domain-containing protein [Variovorax sp. CF079]